MNLNRVAVLGGGPGGLYAARLLKLSHPGAEVTVYEQSSPDDTFGFGVGLATRTQRNLNQADATSFEAIAAVAHTHDVEMQVGGRSARLRNRDSFAIARSTLLSVLEEQAAEAGVRICAGARRSVGELEADLIIAADGINSATRIRMADRFEARVTTGAGLYLWCGTEFELPSAIFAPVTTEHGTFVAHAYPYAADRSTFLIETDEETWRRAGFDQSTERTLPQDSDEVSLRYLEEAFAETLQGHRLIGNRTRWMHFRTVACKRWHSGNVVLLGDAAHTAHYSIGSGTKLAMEDAIALDQSIRNAEDLDQALIEYERMRRPAVDHLQEIAHRSELWWESFPTRLDLPVEQLMVAYMTRAGKVTVERFLAAAPELVRRGLASYAGVLASEVPATEINEWILNQPLLHHGRRFAHRNAPAELRGAFSTAIIEVDVPSAWVGEADSIVANVASEETLWLTGPADRLSVLSRLDLAERLIRNTGALVVTEVPVSFKSDIVAGLASSRTHLGFFTTPEPVAANAKSLETAGSA
ncbi:FAD-dependent monooxygenase [Rhodococcus sp. ACT016]|uniref:FAD-dependent monooxygenase n=1 Tax=Rhodococcus sp. ACT016 TaxID=3134808 RepID=UPI003D2E07CA